MATLPDAWGSTSRTAFPGPLVVVADDVLRPVQVALPESGEELPPGAAALPAGQVRAQDLVNVDRYSDEGEDPGRRNRDDVVTGAFSATRGRRCVRSACRTAHSSGPAMRGRPVAPASTALPHRDDSGSQLVGGGKRMLVHHLQNGLIDDGIRLPYVGNSRFADLSCVHDKKGFPALRQHARLRHAAPRAGPQSRVERDPVPARGFTAFAIPGDAAGRTGTGSIREHQGPVHGRFASAWSRPRGRARQNPPVARAGQASGCR